MQLFNALKLFTVFIVILQLAGCAQTGQTRAVAALEELETRRLAIYDENTNCRSETRKLHPDATKVFDKYGLDEDFSIESKMHDSYFTESEKISILAVWKEVEVCSKALIEAMHLALPAEAMLINEYLSKKENLKIEALQSKITIGELVTENERTYNNFLSEVKTLHQEIYKRALNEHNAEVAQAQYQNRQIAEAVQRIGEDMQSQSQSQITNCNVYGNTVNCTTY